MRVAGLDMFVHEEQYYAMSATKIEVVEAVPVWQRPSSNPIHIALLNMPFAMADRPSIQCGILKAVLCGAGHLVDVHYLNLQLAAQLGGDFYHLLSSSRRNNQLLGEWLFSAAAFDGLPAPAEYLAAVPSVTDSCSDLGVSFDELCEIRAKSLPEFLDQCAQETDWSVYPVIGFTSTFEQHIAVLAMARRIKELAPASTIVVGGANVDDEMGLENIRAFPWLDLVVMGEGEAALCEIAERIGAGQHPVGIPGVVSREGQRAVHPGRTATVTNMDALPEPDYSDYFDTLGKLDDVLPAGKMPLLLVETSRGCWWGQKHHCTFCGLNNNTMAYRSKSSARVLDELRALSRRYALLNFEAVDNIMDTRYLHGIWDILADSPLDYRFFYEVKASLSRTQLRTMSRAGIQVIQPGIESLSTKILQLMRKGTTLLDNVRVLKWARYYSMHAAWNILTGFPGEQTSDYEDQLSIIPLLTHLQPPVVVGRIWLERFSPYYFDPSFPVTARRPESAYSYIYPGGEVDIDKVAYFFEYEMADVVDVPETLSEAVTRWRDAWREFPVPSLVYQRAPDWLRILDRRDKQHVTAVTYHGVEAEIYEACGDWQRVPEQVTEQLNQPGRPAAPSPAKVRRILDSFCDDGLMLHEGGRYLSLAHPVGGR